MPIRLLGPILLLLLCLQISAQEVRIGTDSTNSAVASDIESSSSIDTTKHMPAKDSIIHKIWVGLDIARLPLNIINNTQQSYDFQALYNRTARNYWALEAGVGRGKVDYTFLKYNSDAAYIRLGIDRAFLETKRLHDFDNAFIGVRYAASIVRRGDAWYSVTSPFGGIAENSIPAKSIFMHWGEITAGMRIEIWRRLHIGWIGRGKFLINGGSFSELAPNFVAGYGRADRSTSFDIGLYCTYAIKQWKK